VITLLTRTSDDSKYLITPLQVDFDVSVGQTTIMSINELLLMVVPFTAALVGGIVFLLKKKNNENSEAEVEISTSQSQR